MAKRVVDRRPLKKSAVGDMRERIELRQRDVKPPKFGTSSITEEYEIIDTVWAKMETSKFAGTGRQEFDAVNLGPRATHIFTIRFNADVSAETVVTYRGENYEILNDIDPEERQQYLALNCKLKGDKTLEANK